MDRIFWNISQGAPGWSTHNSSQGRVLLAELIKLLAPGNTLNLWILHLSLRNAELQPRGALRRGTCWSQDGPWEGRGGDGERSAEAARPYLLVVMDTIAAGLLYPLPSLSWMQINEWWSAPVLMQDTTLDIQTKGENHPFQTKTSLNIIWGERAGGDLLFWYSKYVTLIMLCPIAFGSVLTFGYFLGPQRSCFHSPFSTAFALAQPFGFMTSSYRLGLCRLHALAVALAHTHPGRTLQAPVTSAPCFTGKREVKCGSNYTWKRLLQSPI